VLPGTYEVRLSAAGQTVTRRLTITNDPRSAATAQDLSVQLGYERGLAAGIATSRAAIDAVRQLRAAAHAAADGTPALASALAEFDRAGATVTNALAGNRGLSGQLADLQFADLRPTESTIARVNALCARADGTLDRYRAFLQSDLAALNTALTGAGGDAIPAPPAPPMPACEVAR
jgi:hypothetical protein